jgi:SAM-dependent methyltransferase
VFDSWLRHYYSEVLENLDARCRREPIDYRWFRDLDDDLWTILLHKEYTLYPHLRAAFPDLPPQDVQEEWNGRSGMELARQSAGFYRKLRLLQGRYGEVPLPAARVLDFGCGWGRLTRFLARDVASGALFGCDPYPGILGVCERTRVPAHIAAIDYVADSLPFEERFDLIFAFSVFTHLSEQTHLACLRAIHAGLVPGGLLVATIRPPAYADDGMHAALPRYGLLRRRPGYLFGAHADQPSGDRVTYGEAVIDLSYVRERWSELFELLDVSLLLDDIYQVVLTLRRR